MSDTDLPVREIIFIAARNMAIHKGPSSLLPLVIFVGQFVKELCLQ